MPKRGKKYSDARNKLQDQAGLGFTDAVKVMLENSFAKFDETVDIAVRLGVDPRHADQMVRGSVVLPNGIGREVKVLVFAKGEKEKEAQEAGAATLNYGNFIQVTIDFIIVAFAIFMMVRTINKFKKKEEAKPAAPSKEVTLLTEIRDALQK